MTTLSIELCLVSQLLMMGLVPFLISSYHLAVDSVDFSVSIRIKLLFVAPACLPTRFSDFCSVIALQQHRS